VDGSNNPIGTDLGGTFDYARSTSHQVYARGNRAGLFGSDLNEVLPDFDGLNIINTRDQMWTNSLAASSPDCTALRNDGGVYIVTVPAVTVAGATLGVVDLGQMPAGYRFTDAILDVTTLFAGPAVTGIKASLGIEGGAADSFLLAASIEATGQIGLLSADRGAGWEADRYIIPFGASPAPRLVMTVSVTGGAISDINAGSLHVYMQFQRLKV
jgi:hypothetical protein